MQKYLLDHCVGARVFFVGLEYIPVYHLQKNALAKNVLSKI